MNPLSHFRLTSLLALTMGLAALTGCVPAQTVTSPTLDEVRLGKGPAPVAGDTNLLPGETRAEIAELDPVRREIRVQTDNGRTQVLRYDINYAKVTYHGWNYTVDSLEAGDIIAFRTTPRSGNDVDTIRVQEPVQSRTGPGIARRSPRPRSDIVEGTVERIQYDLGVFDIRPRTGGLVTVSIPYNARSADVESFRRLRKGDYVRVEGEFVNPDNLQLLAFRS